MKTKPGSAHEPEKSLPPAADDPTLLAESRKPEDNPTLPAENPKPEDDPTPRFKERDYPTRGPIERTMSRMIASWVRIERERGYFTAEMEDDAQKAIEQLGEMEL